MSDRNLHRELAVMRMRAEHATAKCQEIAAAYEADGAKIKELERENAELRAELHKSRAEIKLYNAITNADSVFAEQARRVIESMRAQFDDEWRLKGTGEWRIREIANGIRAMVEYRQVSDAATDPAYDEWLAACGPSYDELEAEVKRLKAELNKLSPPA